MPVENHNFVVANMRRLENRRLGDSPGRFFVWSGLLVEMESPRSALVRFITSLHLGK